MTAAQALLPQIGETVPVVFGSGKTLTVGHGPLRQFAHPRSDHAKFADAVVGSLAPDARAVGTLSFRRDEPSQFVVGAWNGLVEAADLAGPVAMSPTLRTEYPEPAEYARRVAAAVERIVAEPRLGKVVLGRWLELVGDVEVDSLTVLAGLLQRAGSAYVYALPPEAVAGGGGASLVGASPELLVSRRGSMVRSVPLAGSIPRSTDPTEDQRRAAQLQESAKDLHEHSFVVAAIADVLRQFCPELNVPGEPHLIATDTMWHLASDIRGELRGPQNQRLSALHLAQLLHPTPAVCGAPRELGYEVIADLEPEPRGPMTGSVGWVDGSGDGEFAVTIRSALVNGTSVRLFAGAGIVPASDPASEVAETAAKLETVLRVLEER